MIVSTNNDISELCKKMRLSIACRINSGFARIEPVPNTTGGVETNKAHVLSLLVNI